jgi:hypothetical protein
MQRTLNPILLPFCLDCRNNTLLVYLDLSRNGIGDKCASDIFQAIPAPVHSTQPHSQRGRPLHVVKAPSERPDDVCRICIRLAVEPLPALGTRCVPASLFGRRTRVLGLPQAATSRESQEWRGVAWRGGAGRGGAWRGHCRSCVQPAIACARTLGRLACNVWHWSGSR